MDERDWSNRESRDWNNKDSGPGWNKPADEKAIGTIDDYELLRELGTGGFGSVYLARDKVSRTFVAVKGLPQQVSDSAGELERIRANFALVSKLKHPNVAAVLALRRVDVISCGDSEVLRKLNVKGGDTLLVMDYAPGVTLDSWCRQFPDRKVPVDQAIEVTRQIAAALDVAHKMKIVHRDIKPQNVMVETQSDGTLAVRVLDFGLAAEVRSSVNRVSKEERKDSSGTLQYMAPEQLEGHRASAAMDQYALAALFYELVTGDVPFSSVFECGDKGIVINVVTTKPPEIPEELPRPVRKALARALAKEPKERFATCGDFVAALGGKWTDGRGKWRTAAAVACILALAGLGAWWFGLRPTVAPSVSDPAPSVAVVPTPAPAPQPAPTPPADLDRQANLAAEGALFKLLSRAELARGKIERELTDELKAVFEPEIRSFEIDFGAGTSAKQKERNVLATNYLVQALAKATALKALVDARAASLAAAAKAATARASADAVDAKTALPGRYAEAEKAASAAAEKAKSKDFAAASAGYAAAERAYAALRADVVRATLDLAKGHQAAERWQECLAAAEKVLGWEPGNAEALSLKQEAESRLAPTLRIVAKVGDREVPATALFDGESHASPWKWETNVKPGSRIPSSDVAVEYAEGGKRYAGTISPVTVDWKGLKTVTVALVEYKEPKPGDTQTITLPGGVPMTFCWCPATTSPGWKGISGGEDFFWMGSPASELGRYDDEKRHPVKLTKGFWIAQTPVTQRQYEAVVGKNPTKYDKGPDNPVSDVTWTDSRDFCRQLAARLGDGSRFDLPTEAQWEYACRAGTTTALNNGKDLTTKDGACPNLDEVAWYGNSSGGDKHPVKGKRGNAWNLYDMHGNVWEWCADYYGAYDEGLQVDPTGAASGSYRVNRGGSYLLDAQYCRSANRRSFSEGDSYIFLGIRPVRILPNQP